MASDYNLLFLPLAHDPATQARSWSLAFPDPELALAPVDDGAASTWS